MLETKVKIPNLSIKKYDVNETSYICLSKDGKWCLDFIHNVPQNENELVDVECILEDMSQLKMLVFGTLIAQYFNIPFVAA